MEIMSDSQALGLLAYTVGVVAFVFLGMLAGLRG
jgi:hypothetical protein